MSNCPPNLGFLIDENLSPGLADEVTARGFRGFSVARNTKLRGRGDAIIARHAIDNDLVLVTNNVVDFEEIYIAKECHPGLVFICSENSKLRKRSVQLEMMRWAIDEIMSDCLCQEAIRLTARLERKELVIDIGRYYLPDLVLPSAIAAHELAG